MRLDVAFFPPPLVLRIVTWRERLRAAIERSGMKQSVIALDAGITPETLSRILTAEHQRPSLDTITRIAHAIHENVGWILDERSFTLSADEMRQLRQAVRFLDTALFNAPPPRVILRATTNALRLRILTITAVGLVVLVVLLLILLSIPSIGGFFFERAQLLQQYDVGQGGRFVLQQKALVHILEFPFGMGPEEFGRIYTLQPHNVYLQVFMVSGWIGGLSYILLLLSTLWIGLRSVFVRTPWQTYTIITFAVFAGEIAEGFVIDSDHWRHFYLLLGMVWGLAAASFKHRNAGNLANPRALA